MRLLRWFGKQDKEIVRVLRLAGTIRNTPGDGGPQFRPPRNLSILNLEKKINSAFDCKKVKPKAVVLEIDSPGGSAVQSNLIYTRIRNMSMKNSVPVISFAEDIVASGGYWIACAGDEIYADPNAIIGSIGAVYGAFGVQEAINKLGLEWRSVLAGKHKMRLSPFEPLKEEDIAWVKDIMDQSHANFIELVKSRRKSLDVNHSTVFAGDAFTGSRALKLGLIDGLESDVQDLIKRKYGESVKIERVTPPRQGLMSFFGQRGAAMIDTHEMLNGVVDKVSYGRYGL